MKITELVESTGTMIYHGTNNTYEEFMLSEEGANQYGTGVYFIQDLTTAQRHGKIILTINADTLDIVDAHSEMPEWLTDKLIENAGTRWMENWVGTNEHPVDMFKKGLTGVFLDDIQTLWYDLYYGDEHSFVEIVAEYTDAMYINEPNGWKDLYVVYNMDVVNSTL